MFSIYQIFRRKLDLVFMFAVLFLLYCPYIFRDNDTFIFYTHRLNYLLGYGLFAILLIGAFIGVVSSINDYDSTDKRKCCCNCCCCKGEK